MALVLTSGPDAPEPEPEPVAKTYKVEKDASGVLIVSELQGTVWVKVNDPAIVSAQLSAYQQAQEQQDEPPAMEEAEGPSALDNGLIGLGYVAAVAGGAASFYEHNGLIVNVLKEANGDHYFAKTQAGGVGRVYSQKGPKGAITFSRDISFDQAIMGFALAAEKGWKGVRLRGQMDNSDKTMLFIAAQLYNHVEAHAALMSGKHDDMKMETFSKILNDEESGKIRPLEDVNSPGGKFDPSNMTFIGVTPELSAFMSGLEIKPRLNPTNQYLPQFYTGEDVKAAIAKKHAQLREEVVQKFQDRVNAAVEADLKKQTANAPNRGALKAEQAQQAVQSGNAFQPTAGNKQEITTKPLAQMNGMGLSL